MQPNQKCQCADRIEIPFKLINNVIILPVGLGDSREFKVILDTGMHFEGLLLYNIDPEDSVALEKLVQVLVPGAGGDEPSTALMADSIFHGSKALYLKPNSHFNEPL